MNEDDTYNALRRTPFKEILSRPWSASSEGAAPDIIDWWMNIIDNVGYAAWLSKRFVEWGVFGWTIAEFNEKVLEEHNYNGRRRYF